MNKNVELNILKLTQKLLYDETFPEYLKLNPHKVSAYSLRSYCTSPFYFKRIAPIHDACHVCGRSGVYGKTVRSYGHSGQTAVCTIYSTIWWWFSSVNTASLSAF